METLTKEKYSANLLTEKEMNLIKQLRQIKYGRVAIYIENNQPVRIDEIKETIKL